MALICLRSFAFLTKESAKKSTAFLIPKRRSFLSFSVKEGAETLTPGRFIPLCSFNLPPLIILQVTVSLVLDKTFSSMSPSSISILSPFFTSFDKFLYVVETISASNPVFRKKDWGAIYCAIYLKNQRRQMLIWCCLKCDALTQLRNSCINRKAFTNWVCVKHIILLTRGARMRLFWLNI